MLLCLTFIRIRSDYFQICQNFFFFHIVMKFEHSKGLTLNLEVPNKAIPFIYYIFHITVLPLSFLAFTLVLKLASILKNIDL